MCIMSRPLKSGDILKKFGGVRRNNFNNVLASEELHTDIDLTSYSP